HAVLDDALNKLYEDLYLECQGIFVSLHQQFLPSVVRDGREVRLDVKTIIRDYTPGFNQIWQDKDKRHKIVAGKAALKILRAFFRLHFGQNLPDHFLVNRLAEVNIPE